MAITPNYQGHRKRVKNKFLKGDASSFYDYELLEMLLFLSSSRKDTKPLAKEIIAKYKNFKELILAKEEELRQIENINDGAIFTIKLLSEINSRISNQPIIKRKILNNPQQIIRYCMTKMSNLKHEELRALFLDKQHNLISDDVLFEGSFDRIEIDPIKIVKKALNLSAHSLILTHNHPSGDEKPSNMDIKNTNKIILMLKPLNIKMHDHIIIAKNSYYSFTDSGLI